MAAIPSVNPGDLITAELMNQIITRVNQIDTTGPTGTVSVPSLFGLTLGSARAILIAPTTQLAVGGVLDTGGAVINPTAPATASRIVLMQSKAAGERVAPGTSIDLVVHGTGSGSAPAPAPTIVTIAPSSAPMNSSITIDGTNFAALFSANTVTFDGVPGTVNPGNLPTKLSVIVPTTIPGAPKSGVQVVVTVSGVASNAFPIAVTAAEADKPTINDMQPAGAQEGTAVVITGTNFGAAPANNEVRFDGHLGTINSGGGTTLNVTVPTTVTGPAPKFDVQLTVKNLTTGKTSNPKTVIITPQ